MKSSYLLMGKTIGLPYRKFLLHGILKGDNSSHCYREPSLKDTRNVSFQNSDITVGVFIVHWFPQHLISSFSFSALLPIIPFQKAKVCVLGLSLNLWDLDNSML